jgi:tetratricopeptide (TPR) repeat protein
MFVLQVLGANRRLRGDLDTIVLKAMQKDPARRYRSVIEFSEDVRRYLDGLPVARAPTPLRTAQRSSYAAIGSALRHGCRRDLARHRHRGVDAAGPCRAAAVRTGARAGEHVLFQFYDQVSPLAGSTEVRASIVSTARTYLDGLAKEAGNDRQLTLELAQAYERLGNVQGRTRTANLGQLNDARLSYQKALDLYARLGVNAKSSLELRRGAARVLIASSGLELDAYKENVAEPLARRVLDVLGDDASDPETRALRASGEANLGEVRRKQGHTTEALALFESARRAFIDLRDSGYTDPGLSNQLSGTQQRLAKTKVDAGDLDGALSEFQDLLRRAKPCEEGSTPGPGCRNLGVLESWTADVYVALDRPNLNEPAKAAALYEHALRLQQRIAALDQHDRQGHFDLAARYGKLGDAVWMTDPKRALELYDQALSTAKALVSEEQFTIFRDAYEVAICRPLIQLHRFAEARNMLNKVLEAAKAEAQANGQYADRLGEISVRRILTRLLIAEGKIDESKRVLREMVKDLDTLRADNSGDLAPIFYLADAYRALAAISTGPERSEALLSSARAWHSWPATSFTLREEQKDLAAARASAE